MYLYLFILCWIRMKGDFGLGQVDMYNKPKNQNGKKKKK